MDYRRVYMPGGSYFFTVNLAERKSTLLIDKIKQLKDAFIKTKRNHSFKIDAIVILPDHFHMIMTLPKEDIFYSKRLGLIKSYFSREIEPCERITNSRQKKR